MLVRVVVVLVVVLCSRGCTAATATTAAATKAATEISPSLQLNETSLVAQLVPCWERQVTGLPEAAAASSRCTLVGVQPFTTYTGGHVEFGISCPSLSSDLSDSPITAAHVEAHGLLTVREYWWLDGTPLRANVQYKVVSSGWHALRRLVVATPATPPSQVTVSAATTQATSPFPAMAAFAAARDAFEEYASDSVTAQRWEAAFVTLDAVRGAPEWSLAPYVPPIDVQPYNTTAAAATTQGNLQLQLSAALHLSLHSDRLVVAAALVTAPRGSIVRRDCRVQLHAAGGDSVGSIAIEAYITLQRGQGVTVLTTTELSRTPGRVLRLYATLDGEALQRLVLMA